MGQLFILSVFQQAMEKKCRAKQKRKRQRERSPEQAQLNSEISTETRKETFGSRGVHGSQANDSYHGGMFTATAKYTKVCETTASDANSNTEVSANIISHTESERQKGGPESDTFRGKLKSKANKKQKWHKRKCTKNKSNICTNDSSHKTDWNLNPSTNISELGECRSAETKSAEHFQRGKQFTGDERGAKHPRKQMDGDRVFYQGDSPFHSQGGSRDHDFRGGHRGHYHGGRRHDSQVNSRGAYQIGNRGAYQRGNRSDYEGSNKGGFQGYNSGDSYHRGSSRGYNQDGRRGCHKGSHREDCQGSKSDIRKGGNRGIWEDPGEGCFGDGDQGSNQGRFHNRSKCGRQRKGYRGCRGRGAWSASSSSTITREVQSEASSSQSGNDPAGFHIPGFYYDPEKKRHFKIQQYSGSADAAVTKESIARKEAEAQRQKDLAAFNAGTSAKIVPSTVSGKTPSRCYSQSVSSLVLNGYQRGEVNQFRLQRTLVVASASNLRHTGAYDVLSIPRLHRNVVVEHMMQMEVSKEHDQLLCLWSVSGTMMERLQLVTVKESKRAWPRELSLQFSLSNATILQSWNKITSMCWSEFSQRPDKKYVLYTTMCHTGHTQSMAAIANLDAADQSDIHFFDCDLGRKMVWTCAWNYPKQQFSVGTEKGCLLIDVTTRQLWQFNTNKSDALAQIFSKEGGGNTMYTGTRCGSILQHDLRRRSSSPICLMNHHLSVCCLRLSPDEYYMYASDFSGKIKKWDLRMKKVLLRYDGLTNKQSKLPFHIDETQSLLYAAGQDCYTKIWCLNSGRLLNSIPPPYEASLYTVPAVQFSTRWGGVAGNIGLIMGAQKNFYLYGLSSQGEED